jgi:predicted dehydrogenase
MSEKIKVAVLGAGGRSRYVVNNLLRDSGNKVEIAALFDPDEEVMKLALTEWGTQDFTCCCKSEDEAILFPGVQWVMVFSPNACHKRQIIAAFNAGKHVFSEKPLASTIEDCLEIFEAHRKYGLLFATGFVLRYAPIYRKVKELLDSGVVGSLQSIEANECILPDHGGYIMCNWRRKTAIAGPHILEKCCHDLDLINWFCGSLPIRVAAFGKRSFFRPENAFLMEKYGKKTFQSWFDPHEEGIPFNDDNDLQDHLVSISEFRNGVQVSFTATMSNAIPERRMHFICSEGTVRLDLYTGKLEYRILGQEGITEISFREDLPGGGDSFILRELYDSMCNGTPPRCSGNEGLESAVWALAIDQAARERKVVDLNACWRTLGR